MCEALFCGSASSIRAAPEDLLVLAQSNRAQSIAFTYNEPTVFFELLYETAGMALKKGIRNVLVTNGYMSKDCLSALSRCICAANVDLKSFSDGFYRKYCGARLQPVLDNLKTIKKMGWWLEVTTLIIPGVNDGQDELAELAHDLRELVLRLDGDDDVDARDIRLLRVARGDALDVERTAADEPGDMREHARLVVDDEGLAELLGEPLPDGARHHVGGAAGGQRHHDVHGPVRPAAALRHRATQLRHLHVRTLTIADTRAAKAKSEPTQPMKELVLPVGVDAPFTIDTLAISRASSWLPGNQRVGAANVAVSSRNAS